MLYLFRKITKMTNKEFREMLGKYPDDAIICIEYCDPEHFKYDEDNNRILID